MAGSPEVYRAAVELLGCHKLPICNDPRPHSPAARPLCTKLAIDRTANCYYFHSWLRNVYGG